MTSYSPVRLLVPCRDCDGEGEFAVVDTSGVQAHIAWQRCACCGGRGRVPGDATARTVVRREAAR